MPQGLLCQNSHYHQYVQKQYVAHAHSLPRCFWPWVLSDSVDGVSMAAARTTNASLAFFYNLVNIFDSCCFIHKECWYYSKSCPSQISPSWTPNSRTFFSFFFLMDFLINGLFFWFCMVKCHYCQLPNAYLKLECVRMFVCCASKLSHKPLEGF